MGASELKSFISYRRDDAIVVGNVDRIYEQLSGHFGGENVFMDVDTIPPGQDFRHVLDEAVARADVLLAVMGRDWVRFIRKRSRDPKDFVRIEIESAFRRNIPVVPLLIGDTKMPLEKHLPATIKKLAWCNAVRIDPRRHFQMDVERLIAGLETHYGREETTEEGGGMKDEVPEPVHPPQAPQMPQGVATILSPPEPAPANPQPGPARRPAKPPASSRKKSPVFGCALVGVAAIAVLAFLFARPWNPRNPVEEGVSLSPEPPETVGPPSSPKSSVNPLGMQFVPVPGTNILMSVWETRVKDYAAFAAENPGIDLSWKDYEYRSNKQGPDHPVVNVSWEDAKLFCEWLSRKEGRAYRLPTDHEWSVAVGIGDREDPKASPEDKDGKLSGIYPWGTEWPPPKDSGNFSGTESASSYKFDDYTDAFPFTAPVGSFELNHHGIKDLSGNVWEWCADLYDEDKRRRVLRGGSWGNDNGYYLGSSYRFSFTPTTRLNYIGFRCVLEVGGSGG